MAERNQDVYDSKPMRGLLAAEAQALAPELQRCAGAYALQVSAIARARPPALPMLDRWVHLHLDGNQGAGDLRMRLDEPLPFLDDAFGLVLLSHALEVASDPPFLLREAARVLAPGGILALTGMHPASGWLPWLLWRRQRGVNLESPLRIGHWLRGVELNVERVQRVGPMWPSSAVVPHHGGPLGGGYLLIARKRRLAAAPIRLRPRAIAATPVAGLAPGARRSAAA
ncbi:methyltransferase domain-containing protein [Frateuria sp. MAH-13]|uniref:Methyltransferase domain-containing protein n=1 Tax=Frateuria flava TaxID=2821489 RepID=A0ABS4DID2_9GAMM|nr:methyltransferase domain-containing protein [Frateuria flava]MBP1472807.1 methyltransferase domain-containing protein [Frateuria flava]